VTDNAITILVGVISAVGGYLLWAWQQRIRPWFTPLEFTTSLRAKELVDVPEVLAAATGRSLLIPEIPAQRAFIGAIAEANAMAAVQTEITRNSLKKLRDGITQLQTTKRGADNVETIQSLLVDAGISRTLAMALYVQSIDPPAVDTSIPQTISTIFDPDRDGGCFVFEFPKSTVGFGENLAKMPFARVRLAPFVELASRPATPALAALLRQLQPLLQDEITLAAEVTKASESILDNHARWRCELSITNFGTNPFIVFSDEATLDIRDTGAKPISLPCRVLRRDQDRDWVLSTGVQVIPPGTTQDLGIVTSETQLEMTNGHLVRAIFQKRSGMAQVQIRVHGLASLGRQRLQSQSVAFAEAQQT